jgi:cytochrome P450
MLKLDVPLIPDKTRPAAPVPLPRPLSLFGAWRAVRDNPLSVFTADAYKVPIFFLGRVFRGIAFVNDPEAIERVLVVNAGNYKKSSQQQRRIKPALGEGLLTAEGETWRSSRRIAAPLFSPKSVTGLFDDMRDVTLAMVERWQPSVGGSASLDLASEFQRLTYEIVSQTVFSGTLDHMRVHVHENMARYFDTLGRVDLASFFNLPEWLPSRGRFDARDALKGFREIIDGAVAARNVARAAGDSPTGDLLDRLTDARDPHTGKAMPTEIVANNVLTFLAAGHETTANALAWAGYLLATFPWADERLAGEFATVLDNQPASLNDYERLSFARAFIDETLRLYPPAPFLGREAIADDELCDKRIKAGSQVIISPWIVHRHRALWHEPELFAPDRFSPERRERIERGAFIPFGLGPRVCIGQTFAMQEILTVLSILVPLYRFELTDPTAIEARTRITLQPRNGIKVRLVKR